MPQLAHGLVARFPTGFDSVVNTLQSIDIASNVYYEILDSRPRIALFVGEKYFFRAKNALAATTIVIESGLGTIVKVVACGGRESIFDFFDLGASRDYARMIVKELEKRLGTEAEIVAEVDHLSSSKSGQLWTSKIM